MRDALANCIERDGDGESADFIRHRLDADIKQCMVDVMKVCMSILLNLYYYIFDNNEI
jgi:hypothetical protein